MKKLFRLILLIAVSAIFTQAISAKKEKDVVSQNDTMVTVGPLQGEFKPKKFFAYNYSKDKFRDNPDKVNLYPHMDLHNYGFVCIEGPLFDPFISISRYNRGIMHYTKKVLDRPAISFQIKNKSFDLKPIKMDDIWAIAELLKKQKFANAGVLQTEHGNTFLVDVRGQLYVFRIWWNPILFTDKKSGHEIDTGDGEWVVAAYPYNQGDFNDDDYANDRFFSFSPQK